MNAGSVQSRNTTASASWLRSTAATRTWSPIFLRRKSRGVPGGRFELPTNPESFRGCSTAANDRLRAADFSFVLVRARFSERFPTLLLLFWLRSRSFRPNAWLWLYDRADAERSARADRHTNQCSGGRLSPEECKPMPSVSLTARGEIRTPDQGLMSPLLYH